MSTSPTPAQRREALGILGLDAGARPEQITAAYRRLVLATHPDTANPRRENPEPAGGAGFDQVVPAYRILSQQPAGDPGRVDADPVTIGAEVSIPAHRHRTVRSAGPDDNPVLRGPVRATSARVEPPIAAGPVYYRPAGSPGREWR